MFRPSYVKFLLFLGAAHLAFVSCDRDKDIAADTPAYHIAQSEKLALPASIQLPDNLPAGNSRIVTYYAVGVQKYKSQAKAGTNAFEWVFVAPQADLYDASNSKVGTHSAGPTWQVSAGDSIYAQAFTPAKTAASPDAASVDWLLLMPKNGKTPTGKFANVSYIHRIATKGGKAPASAPAGPAETVEVPYTAVYRFTRKNQ